MMYEIPPKITPDTDSGYLEEMTKAIFRSGFSWSVIRNKWENFQKSFDGFDLDTLARYGDEELKRLYNDASIVRNRRKIAGTIDNARTMISLIDEHGSFQSYLRSLDHLDYYERVKDLTGRFAGLGRTGAFVFLHCANEQTPCWHDR